ncbi:MAG TPA: GNAT family N-acetyltransferase, partial [Alphaproteobacteria bacterium]|nr:GNAT family N-acetyltransferase [Alphaproteobacteria bacterium]
FAALIPSKAKFLSGPRYALLRAEFAAARAAMPPHRAGWLACVGGVDFHNSLGKILDAWEMLGDPKSHLDLVVGGKSPNLAALKARIAGLPDVALHVDVPHLAGLMASAALFVGSAGGIAWECCCLGLPAVMGIAAANQEKNYAALLRARAGFGIDRWQDAEPHRLAAHLERARRHPRLLALVARRAMRLVDGLGAARVANFLLLDTLRLRCATMADALPSLDWRNHEQTRRYFLNPAPISKDVHMDWWRKTLADKNRDLLIAEIGGAAVGVLRLDIDGKGAVIDIYTDPGLDGFGLGATMLRAGKSWAKHERPTLKRLIAEILPENKASRAAFARAGFISQDTKWIAEL